MRLIAILIPAILLFGACSLLVDFEDEKTSQERNCHDTLDNDGDGEVDCLDQDCFESEDCTGPNVNNLNNVVNQEFCDNGDDDDGDGMVDCDDPDCMESPECSTSREICDNNWDDDGDGMTDCADEECMTDPLCDTMPETDCGNFTDDDGNGYIDCDDPDCNENPICSLDLELCNDIFHYTAVGMSLYYYQNIYDLGNVNCPQYHYCTILQEFSSLPYCYPAPDDNAVPAFSPCGPGQPCGPGLVCGISELLSADFGEVCLPWCAPGFHPGCIGETGICFQRWNINYDPAANQSVELWTCDIPQCHPMRPGENGCNPITRSCYPEPSLFGAAACHDFIGTLAVGMPCPSGDDLTCVPGSICRTSPAEASPHCHSLCLATVDCGTSSTCVKDDPRQHFGYCK